MSMSKYKVVDGEGRIGYRVWMHRETGQLGIGLPGTCFGDIWFILPFEDDKPISGDFSVFLDDPRDPDSIPSAMMVDLGPL